jgi:subfamily B ATP-binding cassette protein MsbA
MKKTKSTTDKKKKSGLRKAFSDFMWPRRKILLIGLVLILISRASSFVLPMQTKVLLDEVVPQGDYDTLKFILISVIGAISIQALTSFALTRLLSIEAQHLIAQLRVQVQEKVLSLPISYFDNTKSGALVSRIMSDVEGVRNIVGTGLVQLIGGTLTSIGCVFFLININPNMTLFVLIPVLIF